jgi:3-oxoacyl-[acyl-carrier protein] reductase
MDNVIVTGASRGIGLAIANRLARDGFNVLAVARTKSDALSDSVSQRPGSLIFSQFDLKEVALIPDFVRALTREFGPIYGLVNNAGIGTDGLLATIPDGDIEALIRLNTLSPILMSKYATRSMMVHERGRVINVCSIVAATGFSGLSVYAATKASLVGFTKSLAREVGRVGINVNAIAPGFISTEMTRDFGEDRLKRVVGRSALHRLAEVEDIAAMTSFLMGEAGRNITGSVMTIDAGSTA